MNPNEQIELRAAQWVCRRDSSEWSAQDQAALDAWLAEATEHRVAWLRLQSIWRRADRLAALAAPPRRDEYDRRSFYRRRWPRAMAASFIFVVMLGSVWHHVRPQHSTYVTGIGGHQTVPLADGSRLELNTRTRVRAEVDAEQRVVWLDRGEAYFEIRHDPTRPFVVYAGDRRITVLGTRFAVRRDDGHLEVAVVEGRVQVDETGASNSRPPAIMTGGDILFGKPSGTLVAIHAADKVSRDLSWRNGVLIFDQSTLAEAAAEFNRYNRTQLILADEQTAGIRIGGSFDADAVDAFVRLLERGFGLTIEEYDDEIRISRR